MHSAMIAIAHAHDTTASQAHKHIHRFCSVFSNMPNYGVQSCDQATDFFLEAGIPGYADVVGIVQTPKLPIL